LIFSKKGNDRPSSFYRFEEKQIKSKMSDQIIPEAPPIVAVVVEEKQEEGTPRRKTKPMRKQSKKNAAAKKKKGKKSIYTDQIDQGDVDMENDKPKKQPPKKKRVQAILSISEDQRINTRARLLKVLEEHWENDDNLQMAEELEDVVFKRAQGRQIEYNNNMCELIHMAQPPENPKTPDYVQSPADLFTVAEGNSAKLLPINDRVVKKEMTVDELDALLTSDGQIQLPPKEETRTRCPACKDVNAILQKRSVQNASGDEGMLNKEYCPKCGYDQKHRNQHHHNVQL